jgi:hypothetical protein
MRPIPNTNSSIFAHSLAPAPDTSHVALPMSTYIHPTFLERATTLDSSPSYPTMSRNANVSSLAHQSSSNHASVTFQ